MLPKTFNHFSGTLLKELLKNVSEIPATLDFDAVGRIYEDFLGEFAMSEGQGGVFYRPSSIVQRLAQVIERFHGRILDPACGSGDMFVQSARFVAEHPKNPAAELAICGVEKTDETGRLARLNLAAHGLEGDPAPAPSRHSHLAPSNCKYLQAAHSVPPCALRCAARGDLRSARCACQ
ncbi:MAG: HsdM family class I SAM-dependent methyltransferase [Steroidobacteraceae bacterium]